MDRYAAIPAPPGKNAPDQSSQRFRRPSETQSVSSSSRRLVESASSGSNAQSRGSLQAEQRYVPKVPSDHFINLSLSLSQVSAKRAGTAEAELRNFDGVASDIAKIKAVQNKACSQPSRNSSSKLPKTRISNSGGSGDVSQEASANLSQPEVVVSQQEASKRDSVQSVQSAREDSVSSEASSTIGGMPGDSSELVANLHPELVEATKHFRKVGSDGTRKSIVSLKSHLREKLDRAATNAMMNTSALVNLGRRKSTVVLDGETTHNKLGFSQARTRAQQPRQVVHIEADLDLLYEATAQKPKIGTIQEEDFHGKKSRKTGGNVRIASLGLSDIFGDIKSKSGHQVGGSFPSKGSRGTSIMVGKDLSGDENKDIPKGIMKSRTTISGIPQDPSAARTSRILHKSNTVGVEKLQPIPPSRVSQKTLQPVAARHGPRITQLGSKISSDMEALESAKPSPRGKQSVNLSVMKQKKKKQKDYTPRVTEQPGGDLELGFEELKGLGNVTRDCDASRVFKLASELNMPVDDVRMAKYFWDEADADKNGVVSQQEFQKLLAKTLSHKCDREIPAGMLRVGLFQNLDQDGDDNLDFEEFAKWFSAHSFMEDVLLTEEQRHLRTISRKYEMSFAEVERIKHEFDHGDHDGSGHIDIDEFHQVLYKLIKVPHDHDGHSLEMPASRVHQFWKEIDQDGSGEVDFEEFLSWYIRYFRNDGSNSSNSHPIDSFYKAIRPVAGSHDPAVDSHLSK
eukprot:gnl/MRDRNA2_/MRDRNA2_72584_c0_seq1.p1 gnl/MRDRNA2_/MRDRNA2_72584_c0~~gnl/MRDRNA2_/MRDRNA2_72584_c0_seq1.p1  ORF type:complete len:763 (-),score=129.44 gnl/MRDRNA2_/MRDRNA2_72584_c0_seq1:86-2302(-)